MGRRRQIAQERGWVVAEKQAAQTKAGTSGVARDRIVDAQFSKFVETWRPPDTTPTCSADGPDANTLTAIVDAQLTSRHLDLEARAMRARGEGYYTIASAGHEGNAVVGHLLRPTDPAFLHYRSGGFMMARSRQVPGIDPIQDTVLSLAAAARDPIAGGRHKVWGSRALWVPPQTSTIASHLPKAVGTAIALEQARRLLGEAPVPADSVSVCSFGDASVNHAAAQAAFNSAGWTAHQGLPCPVLFVCEDNGIGISVTTPAGWSRATLSSRPGIAYFEADGCDPVATWRAATAAITHVRHKRQPACLHLRMVRLLGHAGSDVETGYRDLAAIEADEAADPLLRSAETVLGLGIATPAGLLAQYEDVRERVQQASRAAAEASTLADAQSVMAPLAPYSPAAVAAEAARTDYEEEREAVFGGAQALPECQKPRHLAVQINRALADLMAQYPEMTVFGEDVARKGGVYAVTTGLHKRFPATRVFNTLLDETTILGMAQGQAMMGLLPVAEIQYLAYYHNASDQLRGEAASLQFFSADQFRNPMIVRVAGLAYQKGFGGHFHNDNSFAALRDIPGVVIACPARGDDAVGMLRTLAALARVDGRVCVFLEPIALYMTRDLHEAGDDGWLTAYPPPGQAVALGEGRVYHPEAADLLMVTYGNGVPMALRAARQLAADDGLAVRVLDLRWLQPLNREQIRRHAAETGRVLVVDESRDSGGVGEAIITALAAAGQPARPMRRVCARDSFVPLGPAADHVLPATADVVAAARELMAVAAG